MARGVTTSVKAYQGEVESLTSAQSQGVGIRVIRDHRQGFAHCGTLDEDVVLDTLADARDNTALRRARRVVRFGRTRRRAATEILRSGSPALEGFSTDKKVELALEIERRVKGLDPRVTGVRVASYGDSTGEYAIATSTGMSCAAADAGCHVSVSALAVDGDETKIGGGIDAGRDPDGLGSRSGGPRRGRAGRAVVRGDQAAVEQARHRPRTTLRGDRARHRRRHAHRRAGAQGSVALRGSRGRGDRLPSVELRRRSRPTSDRSRPTLTTAKVWPPAATGLIEAGPPVRLPAERVHRSPVGHALDGLRSARLPIDSGRRPACHRRRTR